MAKDILRKYLGPAMMEDAIMRLAKHVENGELLASTDPTAFLDTVTDRLDHTNAQLLEMRALALALYQECRGDRVEGTWEELMKRAKTELSKADISCD